MSKLRRFIQFALSTSIILFVGLSAARPYPVAAQENSNNVSSSLLAATWYVATTGNDSNSCSVVASPCATINGGIGKAADGDTIKVATGTYTGTGEHVVLINKSVALSGGWNGAFTTQNGTSIIDGQNARRVVYVNVVNASLERFTIKNGQASSSGGGIWNHGNLTITDSSIEGNSALHGGGIFNNFSDGNSLTLNNTTLINNSASNNGGGIYNHNPMILNNSTINNNSATYYGGGIYNLSNSTNVNNTTISENSATSGGGINNESSILTLNNTTISNNLATSQGGGIYTFGGSTLFRNSILGGNTTPYFGPDCFGSVNSNGNNIISNIFSCSVAAVNGDKFNVNPILGTFLPAQGHHPLLPGSPAINAGNSVTCLPADQRGVARVGTCDIGAYEYTIPGSAASLSIVSGSGQRTSPTFAFSKTLKAAVVDSLGSPVPNVNVTFTAPGSGVRGTFANTGTNTTSVLTSTDGVATTSDFIANNQFGPYNVSAFTSGLSPVNFSFENAGWYVSTSGNDSNSCSALASPCLTINGAINKAIAGDSIVVAAGTYTGTTSSVISISKDIRLSGGWNTAFTTQTGASIIDGQNFRRGVYVAGNLLINAALERFAITNGNITNWGGDGGGIYNRGVLELNNVTLSNNIATYGGGIHNSGILSLNNVTLSNNIGGIGGGIYSAQGTLTIKNTLIGGNNPTFSSSSPDCYGTVNAADHSLIGNVASCSVANGQGNLLNVNPQLGAYNSVGGYHPLLSGSPAIDAGNPTTCLTTDQLGISRPQGQYCDIGAIEFQYNLDLTVGNTLIGVYVPAGSSVRQGLPGINNGPVKIVSTNSADVLAALRVIWKEPGFRFSYSEMMGLPKEQLSTEYWFPWYNNAVLDSMDQGFRIANVNATDINTIEVRVGGSLIDSFTLGIGASVRVSYSVDSGPIQISCTTCVGNEKIIAALRIIWQEPGYRASYSEMMGLPKEHLSNEYWFPWYNNAVLDSMDQGFRIANISATETNMVQVWVGSNPIDSFDLGPGASTRVGYDVDNGPVRIVCSTCNNIGSDKILAALRVIWKEPGFRASYSEMMGLPKEQLSAEYWFPWYNNAVPASMDQGFRIANVSPTESNTVEVWVGTTKLATIPLAAGASTRVGYNVDNGPIRIVCTTCTNSNYDQILAALRVIWKEPGYRASYSEMMGLPNEALSNEYWFPWYNFAAPNSMDQGFRIAMP